MTRDELAKVIRDAVDWAMLGYDDHMTPEMALAAADAAR